MNRMSNYATVLVLAMFAAGCSSTGSKNTDLTAGATDAAPAAMEPAPADSSAEVFSSGDASSLDGSNLDASSADTLAPFPSSNTVYYEFDSSQVDDKFNSVINEHAAYLNDHPNARVSIEGHADERGTREYNMGLGERRANAVQRFLALQGVAESQLSVVSYGEEKPVAFGHNETSWRLNRRAEIIYTRR